MDESELCEHSRQDQESRPAVQDRKPETSNGETSDGAARSGSGQGEAEDNKDENVGNVGNDLLNSKDNPILLNDDEEASNQLFTGPIKNRPSSQFSGRRVRRKRKREPTDYIPWANTEFKQHAAGELDSTWRATQISWIKMKPFMRQIRGVDQEVDAATAQFKDKMSCVCREMEDNEELDPERALELDSCWKKVEEKLRGMELLRNEREKEYPDSMDRKDEDEDGDFGIRRRFKVQRR
ncbi:hypothetical protein K469DRAFT_696355 [Zopfia rhizophila CBS 207.26]|uniref:Uncharacterized protein n=1 Tax=Zopfia rhizophila CBS 207.26 TaxID=1314779 RepID=A0A6A6DIQ5_9PEZI|nr:hypothetical protein K469DRAFT_696355 [Zopfia rhizophila CBS 207.26]